MVSAKRRILCIDDKDTCQLYDLLFSRIDKSFYVTYVTSEQQAIDFIKNQSFDLYILELRLSGIDALELCRKIRRKNPQKPILFYSGWSSKIDRDLALAAGANAYLVKAQDFDKFLKTVKEFIKNED